MAGEETEDEVKDKAKDTLIIQYLLIELLNIILY